MTAAIVEEGPDSLAKVRSVPIRFRVQSVFRVAWLEGGLGGLTLTEESVSPYEHDYDEHESPESWAQWDLTTWGFFAAYEGKTRVGSAIVARGAPGLDMLEHRADLAVLWDLRVSPDHRGRGIGRALLHAAERWSDRRGARTFKVETQNMNVPACRVYARMGFRLEAIRPGVYERFPEQVQLLWYKRVLAP